jgi:hypothetical protein
MFKIFLKCLALAGLVALIIAGFAYFNQPKPISTESPTSQEKYIPKGERGMAGATIPVVVSLFETSLQSSITDSATSMTLVSGTDRAGSVLSGYLCFTIDEGTSVAEFVCGSASSTAVTSMTRGISPITGTSTVSSLRFSHRRGASVKVTNYPQLAILSRILNGNESLPNPLLYDGISTTTLSSNTSYLASVAYVNGQTLQGAPTATGSTPGVLQIATRTQMSSGVAQSGPYTLVPSNAYFNYTPQAATSVPVSNASGKIAQGWLDLTQPFTFTGLVTHSATSSLAATSTAPLILRGVNYAFPASQGGATTTLVNDGSGNLRWGAFPSVAAATTTILSTTFGTATTVLQSLTIVPSEAQRLYITGNLSAYNDTANAFCKLYVTIDNAATTTVAFADNANAAGMTYNLNFTYLSGQVSAASHTVKLVGRGEANNCNVLEPPYGFNIFYMGN